MNRQEFVDDVIGWIDLLDFCYEKDIRVCDHIYSEESFDDYVNGELGERARDENWEDVRSWLNELPNGYDYYIKDDYDDWFPADDGEFVSLKEEVLDYMDGNDLWDEDEYAEGEESEEHIDPEDEVPVEEEGVTFAELFTICSSQVQKLENDKIRDASAAELEEAAAFDELFASSGIAVTVEGSI